MLKLHFINVANGDSILVQYTTKDGSIKNFLVDTGLAEIPPVEGSMRIKAVDYLRSIGVDGFEQVVVTHLHPDHVGGLAEICTCFPVKQLIGSYIPKARGCKALEKSCSYRLVSETITILNNLVDTVELLGDSKTSFLEIVDNSVVFDDGELKIEILCADREAVIRQNEAYDSLLENGDTSRESILWAVSNKNENSLRVVIDYVGKRIELDGDYCGPDWESQKVERCDILKVSHHGDCRGITSNLARMLRPKYSIISCQKDYMEKNDRPSKRTIDILRENGSKVFYTDSFMEPGHRPYFWRAVLFTVKDDGSIVCPEEK